VRIVNLLEHTSGFDDNSLMSYANNDPTPLTLAQGLALDSATRVSRWRPGTIFSYCNTGPAIVARIAEEIEGKPWEQIVQERWFTPIGMTTATYLYPDTTKAPMATLYRDNGTTPVPYWHVFIRPAGSINASAHDMGNYVRFLLGRGTIDGKKLLPPEAIARMERSESWIGARAGLTVGYGLNMYRVADTTGWIWTQHNGGVEGGLSDLSYVPEQGIGYAFQINTGTGVALAEIGGLVRAFLTQGATPPAPAARAPLAPDLRPRFAGWYRTVSPRMQHLYFLERLVGVVDVSFSDSDVRVAPIVGKVNRLIPVGSRLFRRASVPVATLAFISDSADGRPEGIEAFGSGLGGSLKRVSGFDAVGSAALMVCWFIGVLLSFLAAAFGGVRWIIRRLRHHPTPRAAAGAAWRIALFSAVMITVELALVQSGADDVRLLGNVTVLSVGAWAAGILFALAALAGAFAAFRRVATETGWQRLSITTVRVVMVLNVIATAYLIYWRFIGWRTWL